MWTSFLLENVHFAVYLFTALVFFAVFWLYFDAWLAKKPAKELGKLAGLLCLSFSFVAQAVIVESTIVTIPVISGISLPFVASTLRLIGYLTLVAALAADPLENEPDSARAILLMPFAAAASCAQPLLAALAGLLYLRRATVGLEDHLKPLAYSFGLLSIVELLSQIRLFEQTASVSLWRLVIPFGPLWILYHAVLFVTALYLCRWVFGYLLKQFQAQLFMVYTTTILIVFLLTTTAFTGLLLRNMETEAQRQIETDVKVLDFALTSQKDQEIADAQSLVQDPVIAGALLKNDRKALGDFASNQLVAKKLSTFLILSENGLVLARGEDRERIGDTLGADPLVKRGLLGESVSTVLSRDGVIAPDLSIRAIAPIKNAAGAVSGAVLIGRAIDTAYVDGMKKTTGLDASIYGDNVVSATTFTAADNTTRLIGMKEEHPAVKQAVLAGGRAFAGSIPIREVMYTAAFLPLKDVDGNPVGMLFVGRPQSAILATAGQSIQYTFIVTTMLLVLSIVPAYFIAKSIAGQLD